MRSTDLHTAMLGLGRMGRFRARVVAEQPGVRLRAIADPLFDIGIYDIDLTRWLAGDEVERVTAVRSLLVCEGLRAAGNAVHPIGDLRFRIDALGRIEIVRPASYGNGVRAKMLGTTGAVRIGAQPDAFGLRTADPSASADYLLHRFGEVYRAQLRALLAALRNGTPPAVTGAYALTSCGLRCPDR